MQPLLCVAAIAAATSVLGAPAHAQKYPWCAQYSSGPLGGASNCGFVLRAQHVVPTGGARMPGGTIVSIEHSELSVWLQSGR